MIRKFTLAGVLVAFMTITGAVQPVQAATDEEIAVSLATLLRSARPVISKNQKHINTAGIGDKGISADMVVKTAKANYKAATGKPTPPWWD
jgi:uracil phosphoribosyltransferase